MLTVQTYSVLETCKVYHLPYKNTQNKGWTLPLQTYNVFQKRKVYHTKVQKFKGHFIHLPTGYAEMNLQKTSCSHNQEKFPKLLR